MESVEQQNYQKDLEIQREIFNRVLPDDMPESFKCSLCEKEAKLIRLTPRVAAYYHDCDALKDIPQLTSTIALWFKRSFGEFDVEHGLIRVHMDD